jgi:hypothetical protein
VFNSSEWKGRLERPDAILASSRPHEVLEQLGRGAARRWFLHKDHSTREIAVDPGQFTQIAFFDPRTLQEPRRGRPLIRIGVVGTHSATFGAARLGEAAPTELELPPGCGCD